MAAKAKPYNPYAYVPGGSSQAVSQAIQAKGYAQPAAPAAVQNNAPLASQTDAPAQQESSAPDTAPVSKALASNPFPTDPGYLASLAAEQAGSQQLDAAMKAAQEAAIVQFGDPGLAQAGGFSLDPLTAAMAQQNTQAGNSTLAQLQRSRDLGQQGIVNTLAAHGIIRSGDLGYKTGQNEQTYGTNLYNAQQGVLGGLASQANQNLQAKQGLRANTTSALTSAYGTYVANPQLWGAATDDGGAAAAANAAAVAPITAALSPNNRAGPLGVGTAAAKAPTSRLAAKPAVNPYRFQTARNMGMG